MLWTEDCRYTGGTSYGTQSNVLQSTDRFLETCYQDNKSIARVVKDNGSSTRLALGVVKKLNNKATEELRNIVDRKAVKDEKFNSYEESEIISTKALLDHGSEAKKT